MSSVSHIPLLLSDHPPSPENDPVPEDEYDRRFAGVATLYGEQAWQKIQRAHVVVVGLGGVGSWAAEALARTGVGYFTLVEFDTVSPSNINRQLLALTNTLGHEKNTVLAQRIRQINPRAQIHQIDSFLSPENAQQIIVSSIQQSITQPIVLDCTDDYQAKLAMARLSLFSEHKKAFTLLMSGSAGGKIDPAFIRRVDITTSTHDPLLAKLRTQLRKDSPPLKDKKKWNLQVVYSSEAVKRPESCSNKLHCGGYGSACVVTGSFGLHLASAALEVLASER